MSRKVKAPKEEKQKVPAYIVTFSDMITLLLTFFVLLLSMASDKSDEMVFEAVRGSVEQAFSSIGLAGISINEESKLNNGKRAIRYKTDMDETEDVEGTPDAKREMIKRLFKKLEKNMKITPSNIVGKNPNFSPTNIRFEKGKAGLDDSAKQYLDTYARQLRENFGSRELTLYVAGLCHDNVSDKEDFILSAKRAQIVSDHIKSSLPGDSKWDIRCWGTGDGGQWTSSEGPLTQNTEIIIAVLTN